MTFKFWGVRGSIPTPLTNDRLKRKISTIIQRIRPADLESPRSREVFMADLPEWLFGTPGGNTTCLEVVLSDGTHVVFDAGSGIRELSSDRLQADSGPETYHVFFTHFHYDHIQGLPFFAPAYIPGFSVRFHSPVPGFEEIIRNQMRHPYFPVTMEGTMRSELSFHELPASGSFHVGSATISWRRVNHPGGAYAYRIEDNGRILVFAPDVELSEKEFERNESNRSFFGSVHAMILDAQYTLGEAIEKYDWGHSSYSLDVDFAGGWRVRKLFLFHHEPLYDDRKLYRNLQAARWYAARSGHDSLEVQMAVEGTVHRV